ncbi:MAG: molybdopterin-guanine dinucleotide biosynthesis protein B [bacterium]|nr:molybdopterin-guanine dinucleotide biosynthesis protein B [bacterium]
MKVIGIIGYKNSGKTTLVVSLAQELSLRGLKVATVKHAHGQLGHQEKDTSKHKEYSYQVAAISNQEAMLITKEQLCLEEILKFIKADIVLVEGFKREKSYPKIICAKNKEELIDLCDGLAICAYGDTKYPEILVLKNIKDIADLIIKKAFKLPNLNCKKCESLNCYEFAKEVVAGRKNFKDCVSLNPKIIVKVAGRQIPMTTFVERIIGGTIKGMLSSLKGVTKGDIEIKIGENL